jgi:hypothetical protein
MKTLILILASALVAVGAYATDYPSAWVLNTGSITLLSATTNQTGSAYNVELFKYHTVAISESTIRTNTVYVDRSLDGSNWIPFYTNTLTTTGQVAEATAVGKWAYMRGRLDTLTGTNCAVTFSYLGGN